MEDRILITKSQPDVGKGQVELSFSNTEFRMVETETPNGPVTEIFLEPRPGFESQTSEAGFSSVKLLNVTMEDLDFGNEIFERGEIVETGTEQFATDEDRIAYFETYAAASKTYDNFHIIREDADITQSSSLNQAIFGGDGDDMLRVPSNQPTDLFGGDGNDTLQNDTAPLGPSGTFDGGAGDDILISNNGVLTGGSGADTFTVIDYPVFEFGIPVIITDFDPATETLELVNDFFGSTGGLEVQSDGLQLTETELNGVTGTLVTVTVRNTDFEEDVEGASAFLQGVSPDEIPEGAISSIIE